MLSAETLPRLHNNRQYYHKFRKSRINERINKNISMNGVTAASVPPDHFEHIWIVTGPAGCGKSTVAQYLAENLSFPYVEGDDVHSEANRKKMAQNIPLTDEERWDWLITLREEALRRLKSSNSVIVTCSALKHKYRDVIRIAAYENPSVQVHFIYLRLNKEALRKRVAQRVGHYMKADMVNSQLAALEEPESEWDADSIDADAMPSEVNMHALDVVKAKLKEFEEVNGTSN